MRHAFLILAHNEFEILKLLVSRLDDSSNDIYIHFDKKVNTIPEIAVSKARLYVLDNRVDVRWGGFSMIEAEYALFESAVANGPYQYYHLLSGVDLPIKSQDYIHDYFDKYAGDEFIGYTWTEMPPEFKRKVQCRHLFPEDFKSGNILIRGLRAGYLRLQEALGIYRNKDVDFKKGSQWVSVTDSMARYFLEQKGWVEKVFHNTFCSDELVMQTLCWKSPFRGNIHSLESDGAGNARAIGWREQEGSKEWILKDWSTEDYDFLKGCPALFARKFNSSNMAFINQILELSRK